MFGEGTSFWVEPSAGRSFWFFATIFLFALFIYGIRYLHKRRNSSQQEAEFRERLLEAGLWERPEEHVLRDLAQIYEITPPANVLSSLQHFDQICQDEINRVEHGPMPLSERIDRIEYLYSIRIQAFSDVPAIAGLDILTERPDPAPSDDSDTLQEENDPETDSESDSPLGEDLELVGVTTSEDAHSLDTTALLADLETAGEPSNQSV